MSNIVAESLYLFDDKRHMSSQMEICKIWVMQYKRILGNIWLQLFLGLIAAIIGVIVSYPIAILLYIKYAGFELFFGMGSSGDQSPITFLAAAVFFILALTFPTLVWLFLNRFGNLKSASNNIRATTFILLAILPLWLYFGWEAFSNAQATARTADEFGIHPVRQRILESKF